MKVLVGVDGSPGSFEAVRQAGEFMSPADTVALYYAAPVFQLAKGSPIDPHVVDKARLALARAVFDEARQQLPPALDQSTEEIVGVQDPRHGLLIAADECGAELLVVGARGLGPLKRLLLGSVSTSLVHAARLPVLVARRSPERQTGELLRVLLACDSKGTSRHAAELLGQLTWPVGASGHVISVLESLPGFDVPPWLIERARIDQSEALAQTWVRRHDEEKAAKQQEIAAYCGQLPTPFQHSAPLVAEGHPAAQILAAIASHSIDLVVLGSRGLGTANRLILGSTSDKVLVHAPCSVLIVRQPEHP